LGPKAFAAAKTVEFIQRGYGHYKLKVLDEYVVIGEIHHFMPIPWNAA